MQLNAVIDDELMQKAVQVNGLQTVTTVIEEALKLLVQLKSVVTEKVPEEPDFIEELLASPLTPINGVGTPLSREEHRKSNGYKNSCVSPISLTVLT